MRRGGWPLWDTLGPLVVILAVAFGPIAVFAAVYHDYVVIWWLVGGSLPYAIWTALFYVPGSLFWQIVCGLGAIAAVIMIFNFATTGRG